MGISNVDVHTLLKSTRFPAQDLADNCQWLGDIRLEGNASDKALARPPRQDPLLCGHLLYVFNITPLCRFPSNRLMRKPVLVVTDSATKNP